MKKGKYIILFIILVIACIFFYQDPYAMEESKILASPSLDNLLGCDNLGRDIFSRLYIRKFLYFINSFFIYKFSCLSWNFNRKYSRILWENYRWDNSFFS